MVNGLARHYLACLWWGAVVNTSA